MYKRAAIISLGCPKNQVDSETIAGLLSEAGYMLANDPADADIIIVNTCAFITDAKEESIDTILQMAKYKKHGRCELLAVAGCLSQRYGQQLFDEMPEVDVFVGTTSFPGIIRAIGNALQGCRVIDIADADQSVQEGLPSVRSAPAYTGYLKIADGCDNRCTYCIIPKLRGSYKSRRSEDILAEADSMAKAGVKELILIAQDTTSYGIDLYREKRLPGLLEDLCKIDGIRWIRLLYCYPDLINDYLIDVIARQSKICNYLDIPIQHISDRVLKAMNRRVRSKDIFSLLERLKERIPDIIIRSTLMVGFPGESDDDFQQLLDFVNKGYIDRLGVFTYSREEDTPAFRMKNQVPKKIAQKRKDIIMRAQQQISLNKNHSRIGDTLEVLVEGNEGETFVGRTYGDAPDIDNRVLIESPTQLESGQFVRVKIEHAMEYDLFGRVLP